MSTFNINRPPLRNWGDAAVYCGLNRKYFVNLVKGGRGPAYIKPSQRTVRFRQHDLDAWIANWVVVEPRDTRKKLAQVSM